MMFTNGFFIRSKAEKIQDALRTLAYKYEVAKAQGLSKEQIDALPKSPDEIWYEKYLAKERAKAAKKAMKQDN